MLLVLLVIPVEFEGVGTKLRASIKKFKPSVTSIIMGNVKLLLKEIDKLCGITSSETVQLRQYFV